MLAIVDYKAGNLTSVQLAFGALGCDAAVTSDPAVIRAAERVVFPGVGAAGAAMAHLDALGLAPALRDVTARGIPFLGICLGTESLFDTSEEDSGTGDARPAARRAVRFRPSDRRDKVPQIGWNQVKPRARIRCYPASPTRANFTSFTVIILRLTPRL